MNTQSNNYCQSMPAHSEENRQVTMLMLLSKLALVVFMGVIYIVMRLLG
jgi:hypothetical protein